MSVSEETAEGLGGLSGYTTTTPYTGHVPFSSLVWSHLSLARHALL